MDEQQKSGPTAYLLQNSTDALVEVDQDSIETAVRSGLYSPKKDADFVVFDPYGERHVVKGEYLDQVLKDGFTLESSKDRYDRELQEQYGSPLQEAAAATAGGARGITYGLSDVAGRALGYGEELAKLKEANPTASIAGEVVGTVGGALLSPTTTAGKVLGAGVRATEAVGAKAAELTAKTLIKEGVKAGVAKKTITDIASKVARFGTEGSIISAGQLVSESALGNADFNAENLAMAVGTGALLGGTLGSAVGVGKAITPALKSAAKPLLDTVESFTSREKAAADVVGWTANKAATVKKVNPQLFKDLPDFLTETGLKVGDDTDDILLKVETAQKEAGKRLGEQIDRYDALLAQNADLLPKKSELFKELASQIDEKYLGLKSATPEAEAALKSAGNYYEELIKSSFKGGTMNLRGLQEARQLAYQLGKTSGNSLERRMVKYAARFYSNTLKNIAEQLSERTGTQDIYSAFLKDHKTYSYASEILPDLIKKSVKKETISPFVSSVLGGASGGILGGGDLNTLSIGAIAGLAGRSLLKSDILKNLVIMGKIEGAQQTVRRSIDKAVKSYSSASKVPKAIKYANMSLLNSAFAQKYDGEKYRKPKSNAEAYSNIGDNLQRYVSNPDQLMQRVNRGTALIYSAAPQTSMQLDSLSVRAAEFLASKMPKKATPDTGIVSVFKKQRPPSQVDLAKFERYLTAVEEPMKVFDAIEEGRLSREHVEALQVVYPAIYQKLQESVMEFVGQNPQMPYNKKLQLGILLDLPTDESLQPENILGLQASFGQQPTQEATSAVNQTVGGLENINKSNRLQTESENTQNRLNS